MTKRILPKKVKRKSKKNSNFKDYYTRSRSVKFEDLPREMIQRIFSYISKQDLFRNVRRVSVKWCEIACSKVLWRQISSGPEVPTEELAEWLITAKKLKKLTIRNRHDAALILKQVARHNKSLQYVEILNCWGTYRQPIVPSVPLCNMLLRCTKLKELNLTGCRIISCKFFRLLGGGYLDERKKRDQSFTRVKLSYFGPITTKQLRIYLQARRETSDHNFVKLHMQSKCNNMFNDDLEDEVHESHDVEQFARVLDFVPLD